MRRDQPNARGGGAGNGGMLNNRTQSNDPSSSFYIARPVDLPPPIMNHRWASDSSSMMVGDGQKSVGPAGAIVGAGAPGRAPGGGAGAAGGAVAEAAHHNKQHGGGDDDHDDNGGGMFAGGNGAGAQQKQQPAPGGPLVGFGPDCRLSAELVQVSPFFRTPPPPPPVFDAHIPRQRFIAKIMRWYQIVEEWCDERRVARFDRDRLIVAPPPRPPLFVEGEAMFAIPQHAQRSPYTVNEWAVKCHLWWGHVHHHFHRIHTQMLGESAVEEKAAAVNGRSADSLLRLVQEQCCTQEQQQPQADGQQENGAAEQDAGAKQ